MLEVRLALKNAHSLVNGDPSLHDCRVGRRRHYAARLYILIDARREVIGDHLNLVREIAFAKKLDGGLSGRRRAGNVFNIRVGLEHILDQFELHFLAGVAVFCRNVLERAVLDRVIEALVARLDPAGPGRAREPRHFDLRLSPWDAAWQCIRRP